MIGIILIGRCFLEIFPLAFRLLRLLRSNLSSWLSLEKLAALKNLVSLSLTFSDCDDLLIDLFEKYSKCLVKLSHLSLRVFLHKDTEISFDCALANLKCFEFFVNSENRLSNFGLFFMQNPQIQEIHCSGGSKMANLPILAGLETFQISGDPFNAKHRANALNLKTLSLLFIPENWIFSNLKSFELIVGFSGVASKYQKDQ